MLLVGELAGSTEVVDHSVIFEARLNIGIDQQPGLPGSKKWRACRGVVANFLRKQQIERMQGAEAGDFAKFGLSEGPERKRLGVGLVCRLRVFREESEIAPIFARRCQLEVILGGRRLIGDVLGRWSG